MSHLIEMILTGATLTNRLKTFLNLYDKVLNYLDKKDELYVFNGYAGSDHDSQLKLTVVNELAWHNLFAQNMFIRPSSKEEAQEIKPNLQLFQHLI